MIRKSLKSKIGKVLYGTFLGLMLTGLLGAFPNPVLAAVCNGATCLGKDPGAYGCTGATVAEKKPATIIAPPGNGYGWVQVRKSTNCNAMWTRTLNMSTATALIAATSWWPTGANPPHQDYSSGTTPLAIGDGGYTHMYSFAFPVKGCGKASWALSAIAIPIPDSTTYCTGFTS